MKTTLTALILIALVSCQDRKLNWNGNRAKPDTIIIQKVNIKAMPLESDTQTFK